ncbi:hypothetical protein CALCODRAFT_483945 [Calocera cornea HHB12733]|uniref:Uncharacterized protein n=1 Tax=Calocera cornea HHB12733 TaxID=1353952 RepID=A0A165FAL9_9BASI|nr:hypothetical protein CALCODRAFT_483945 [Calocera cornea HHB12733]
MLIGPADSAERLRPFALLLFSVAYGSLYPVAGQPFPETLGASVKVAQALYIVLNELAELDRTVRLSRQPIAVIPILDALVLWISGRFSTPSVWLYADICNVRYWRAPPARLWDLYCSQREYNSTFDTGKSYVSPLAYFQLLLLAGRPAARASLRGWWAWHLYPRTPCSFNELQMLRVTVRNVYANESSDHLWNLLSS